MMWKIKESVIEDLLTGANATYPNEFATLLGGNKKLEIIEEFVVPQTITGINFASVNLLAVPFDETIVGSVHSHPNGMPFPSSADKRFFARYFLNAIIGWPFKKENIKFYDSNAKETRVDIVE
jgi:proteasome lid subunit RPN8/RPN11